MNERLRARDLSFLTCETPTTPMHNATVEIFDPGTSGFDHDTLVQLIADRIAFVPRYRQRVRRVPGHLANPVWVDDPHFDLGYHVRRSALPRPGTMDQLRELVARIIARPLDRNRPLWEVYLVEGLENGRVAVLSKAHQALVDGAQIVDLAQVLLDRTPERRELGADDWRPGRPESSSGLLLDAVRDTVATPYTALDTVRGATDSLWRAADATTRRVGDRGQRAREPPFRAGHPARRHPVAAAPLRDRTPLAGRAPQRARRPRRHRQRRHPGDRHRWAAELADDACRVAGRAAAGAGRGAGLGARRRARGHLAGHPDRAALRRPAGGRAEPGGPAAPGVLLVQGAQGHRPGGRRQPASPASPASPRRPSTRSAPGSRRPRCGAASSSR